MHTIAALSECRHGHATYFWAWQEVPVEEAEDEVVVDWAAARLAATRAKAAVAKRIVATTSKRGLMNWVAERGELFRLLTTRKELAVKSVYGRTQNE